MQKWFYHADEAVDVAVMPFDIPDWADAQPWNARHFASEFKKKTKNIGAGDFTYVVGILPFMRGKKRNMPAVHTGHIVLMPDGERVTISDWRQKKKNRAEQTKRMEVDAYLVQAMALPGSSGSPVFVRRTLNTELELSDIDMNPVKAAIPGSLWFLGIWRGAWFGDAPEDWQLPSDRKVPYGIGTVVPARMINQILDCPELQQMRKTALLKSLETDVAVPAGAHVISTKKGVRRGNATVRNMTNDVKRKKARRKGG